ncbi:MAG TPA: hypothetical protein VGA62_07530 [Acidimicrobiia bacterium]
MARPQPGIFAQGTRSHYHLDSFVAFSADPSRFTKMLARMFGTIGDGLHERLTDFSRPVSGSWYFAPSLDALDGVFPED